MIETTDDAVLGGRLRLKQPKNGHRVGLDAMLLAGAARHAGAVVDLGCGVGSAGLAFLMLNPGATAILVDRDTDCLLLAEQNIAANGLDSRAAIVEADIFAPEKQRNAAGVPRGEADLVLTNPPFLEMGIGRASPKEKRRSAHVLEGGTLDDWLRSAASCLAAHGRLAMIHRADAIAMILPALHGRFGAVSLRFIHPAERSPAIRVLVHAIKGSRAPLTVVSPIILADEEGRPTRHAESINQGSGEPWFA